MKAKTSNITFPVALAACSFAAVASVADTGSWQQILPGADFSAYDGRPHEVPGKKWKIDNKSGQLLAATLNKQAAFGLGLNFDYDHQTLNAPKNGQKAVASGHAEEFEWRDDKGLFAKLAYTPTAREHVANQEYKYFSPVVYYDKETGEVLGLHSVALTNDPAVLGMKRAALSFELPDLHQPQPKVENTMNEALALLFSILGLDKPTETEQASLTATLESDKVKGAIAALNARLESEAASTTTIAALTAEIDKGVSLSTHVPVETYNQVLTEMAALRADNESMSVAQIIEQAQKDGKFIAQAELSYLTNLGNQDRAALKATLDSRLSVAALTGKQTKDNPPTDDKKTVAALTAEQQSIATQMGISHEDYAKHLAKS